MPNDTLWTDDSQEERRKASPSPPTWGGGDDGWQDDSDGQFCSAGHFTKHTLNLAGIHLTVVE